MKTQFGPKAAEMVFPIANAFSMIQEESLLEQLKNQQILMTIWRNQNGAMVQYAMNFNTDINTTTLTTTLVWCDDF